MNNPESYQYINIVTLHVRDYVLNAGRNYNPWLIENHLLIVEEIALALCRDNPEAKTEEVLLAVWLHDIGKLTRHFESHEEYGAEQARDILTGFLFPPDKIDHIATICGRHDSDECPNPTIEERILRTADALSHFINPAFYQIVFGEVSGSNSVTDAAIYMADKIDSDCNRLMFDSVKEDIRPTYNKLKSFFKSLCPQEDSNLRPTA